MSDKTDEKMDRLINVMEAIHKDLHQMLWIMAKSAPLREKGVAVSENMEKLLEACEKSGCCEDQCSPNCNAGCH